MNDTTPTTQAPVRTGSYQAPTFEVISLNCEISSYAPDGDDFPLF